MLIGITGTIGAGKGTVVDYLKEKGFIHFSVRQMLVDEINRRGIPVSRDSMYLVANDFRKISPGHIVETLAEKALREKCDAIIESLRSVCEIEALKKHTNSVIFAVDADSQIRYRRVLARKSVTDNISFETFLEQEARESTSDDPLEANLTKCMKLADHVFLNNEDKESLFKEVDRVIQ